jgi:hypothetical protein
MATPGILRLLFCFRKPGIKNLSYIHVMVEDKPTLFIAWEVEHAWVVKLKPIKGKYYASQKALVIAAPGELQEIVLKVANFWRSYEKVLPLQVVQLDKNALSELISGFRPMNKVSVNTPAVSKVRNQLQVKRSIIRHNVKPVELQRSTINIQPFNYP